MIYAAKLGNINFNIFFANNGIQIDCTGFNDTINKFLMSLFQCLQDFNLNDFKEHFDYFYEKKLKSIKNVYKKTPLLQAQTFYAKALKKGSNNFHPEESILILNTLTFEDLLSFHHEWFTTTRAEWLNILYF